MVRVSKETHGKLMEIGKKGESFDTVIARVLDGGQDPKKRQRNDANGKSK